MNFGVIAGIASTTIFMLSQIPMLLKAVRTRNLRSYSLSNILMSATGNMIHWCYILTLPFGPIWFLHSFSSISAVLMLIWYLRYEKLSSTSQTVLSAALSENDKYLQKLNNVKTESGKEISDFYIRFRPYVDSIYRGALILTGSPREAEKLQVEIYMKAFMHYLQADPDINFKQWLLEIVHESFVEYGSEPSPRAVETEVKWQRAMQAVALSHEPATI